MGRLLRALDREEHRTARSVEAWVVVLDSLGWCAALREDADRALCLSPRAAAWWRDSNGGEVCWRQLTAALDHIPVEAFLVRTEALWVWRRAPNSVNAPPRPSLAPSELTRREAEILGWLRQGKSGPEIAAIVGCARRTVESHVARIYKKLGVRSRAQLMFHNPSTNDGGKQAKRVS
ncbi:helix-turn-helix domain-containing protein [Luteolibacter marinus]|uniref:helix-turn-helix transcriptional regulator n=1 Tax=Luteolibacter marinus TaxID=2776705 RepID=UPI001D009A30